jgi:hypothetical protein
MYERSVRWFQAHEREIVWKELREENLFGFGKRLRGTKDFRVMEIVYDNQK